MRNFQPPWPRIKTKSARSVKSGSHLIFALTWIFSTLSCQSAQAADSDLENLNSLLTSPPTETQPDEENLPEIEAKTFHSNVVRKSRSGRVLLFRSSQAKFLPVGRILLMKRDSQPILAVRVIKVYSDKPAFAGRGVRFYSNDHRIDPQDSFLTIEKIADIIPQAQLAQDVMDLKELDQMGPPPPRVPDGPDVPEAPGIPDGPGVPDAPGVPEGPGGAADDLSAAFEEEAKTHPLSKADARAIAQAERDDRNGLDISQIVVQEITYFERHRHGMSMAFGVLPNAGELFSAGGLRYAYTIAVRPFYERLTLQDSVAIEGAAYLYKALNFSTLSDSYVVTSFIGTVRYNLTFSEDFTTFFYAGGLQSFAMSTSPQSSAAAARELSGPGIAVGAGLFFRVAPNWYARLDLGTDIAGLGLMLRF